MVNVLIASSFGVKAMKRLLRRAGSPGFEQMKRPEELLEVLHSACHENLEVRAAVVKELNARYGAMARKIAKLDVKQVRGELGRGSGAIPLLWACCRHTDPAVKSIGRRLAHSAVYAGMRRPCSTSPNGKAEERAKDLSRQNQNLRRRFSDMQRSQARLQARLDRLAAQPKAQPNFSGVVSSAGKRREKQLRRELADQKELVDKLNAEVAGWRSLALREDDNTGCPLKNDSGAGRQPPNGKKEACGICPGGKDCDQGGNCFLRGRKVAVVGGLDRLRPSYTQAINRLGGECYFHTGKTRSGARGLRNLVAKSDFVVCITSINSHGAMSVVKKHCKKCKKLFCPLKGTSVGSLENLLRKAAG